jgi:hypothetical protein
MATRQKVKRANKERGCILKYLLLLEQSLFYPIYAILTRFIFRPFSLLDPIKERSISAIAMATSVPISSTTCFPSFSKKAYGFLHLFSTTFLVFYLLINFCPSTKRCKYHSIHSLHTPLLPPSCCSNAY